MASRNTRRLDVEIGSEAKGDGFKKTESDLDKLKTKLKDTGQQGGKGLGDGIDKGASGLGDKLRKKGKEAGEKLGEGVKSGTASVGSTLQSAGSSAADLFSSGFDPSVIADALSGALESSGGKLGTAAAGLGLAAGVAFTTGLMNGMETEVATDKLAAQLGGSEWAEGMGEVAGNLYLDGFGESVADTGEAVRKVLSNGLLPEDATNAQIEELTGRLLTFTDVMEQDMDMATQAVSNMLRTGLADSGTEALDILTRGIQQGADRAGDLQETFQEYSTMFRDVGLSGQQAMGLITQGLQAGARDADTVADAIKEFAIRAQDGSETSAQGFKDIGLNAKEMTAAVAAGGPQARAALDQVLDGLRTMEDPAARNAAAVALFGAKAEDLGDALFNLDLDTAAAGLGETAGATDKLGSAYDNASSKIETFKRQALEKLTVFVGEEVLPKLEQLKAWAEENPGKFQVVAGVIGGVLVLAFLAWAASAASAAVATLAATWPILLIGAVIAGLAALVVIHFDTIKRWISNVFNWVKENWPLLAAILTGPFGIAVLLITRNWDTIKAGATAVKDWIVSAFNTVKEKVGSVFSWIKDKATGAKDWIVDKFTTVVDFFKDLPGTIADAFSGLGDNIASGIKSIWNNTVGGFGFSVPSWVPGVGGREFRIPELHGGGIFDSGRGEGLAFLEDGEGVFTREQMAAMGDGGGTHVTVIVEGSLIHESELDNRIVTGIKRAGGRGVPITIAGRRL